MNQPTKPDGRCAGSGQLTLTYLLDVTTGGRSTPCISCGQKVAVELDARGRHLFLVEHRPKEWQAYTEGMFA